MKEIKDKSKKEYEKILSNFLQYAVKRINQDQDSFDLESEKKNFEQDYDMSKREYASYIRLDKEIYNES